MKSFSCKIQNACNAFFKYLKQQNFSKANKFLNPGSISFVKLKPQLARFPFPKRCQEKRCGKPIQNGDRNGSESNVPICRTGPTGTVLKIIVIHV